MKTTEEMQAFVDDIRAVCERHGVFIIGTCKSAGIYGEITIFESGRASEAWLSPQQQLTNEVEKYDNYYQVCGVGDHQPKRR